MNLFDVPHSLRALVTWVGSTAFATALFWVCFGTCVSGCVDAPIPDIEPQARVLAAWEPGDCGEPHRVVIELEDEYGRMYSRSVPCQMGGIAIDVPIWGVYIGRTYAWSLGPEIRAVSQTRLDIDAPVVLWTFDTPR